MPISTEQQDAIAQAWKDRARAQGLKPGTKRHDDARMHFVAGACAALHHTDPEAPPNRLSSRIPPVWIVAGMSGRDPFSP